MLATDKNVSPSLSELSWAGTVVIVVAVVAVVVVVVDFG